MSKLLSLFLLFLLSGRWWISPSFAVPINEIQEVRLSKAELALIDGKQKEALRIIYKNLDSKHFHLESYLFLAKLHFQRANFSKAFRVYYFILKKIHSRLLVNAKFTPDFFYVLEKAPAPSMKALEIYFLVGRTYFNLIEEGAFDSEFNEQLLLLSQKYFLICSYYRYNMPSTTLYLARIRSRQNLTNLAVAKFIEAKEFFEEEPKKNPEQLKQLDLLLGEALVKDGFSDAGSLYLKSIYLSQTAPKALKEYANAYLDALSSTYASVTFSHTSKYQSNLHLISDQEVKDFDGSLNQRLLGEVSGITHARNLNLFITKKLAEHWSGIMLVNFLDEIANNKSYDIKDVRNYTVGFDLKYSNLNKSAVKLKYNYNLLYLRPALHQNLSKSTYSNSLTLQYLHTLKSGLLTYSIPFTSTTESTGEALLNSGFSISYSPFQRSRWISPTYSISGALNQEGGSDPDSTVYTLSLSNHSSLRDSRSLFSSLSFTDNQNGAPQLAYTEFSLNFTYSFLFPVFKSLYSSLSAGQTGQSYQDGNKVNSSNLSFGLSYTF